MSESDSLLSILRRDPHNRGLSVMVILPRDRFSGSVRKQIEEALVEQLFDADGDGANVLRPHRLSSAPRSLPLAAPRGGLLLQLGFARGDASPLQCGTARCQRLEGGGLVVADSIGQVGRVQAVASVGVDAHVRETIELRRRRCRRSACVTRGMRI